VGAANRENARDYSSDTYQNKDKIILGVANDMTDSQLFIGGELLDARSGARYDNINPATEMKIGTAVDAGSRDMDAAIAAARHAFDNSVWSRNRALRQHCLTQLRDNLRAAAAEMRVQIAAETGAPLGLAYGYQCDGPIAAIDWTLQLLNEYAFESELPVTENMGVASRRLIWREACGVVAAITPWNAPLQINLAKIIPALAAGCTVVLKAAPETPWAAAAIGAAAANTDLPAGVLNIITAHEPHALGEQLVLDPRIDMVSFTGSTATGRQIMAAAAGTLKKVFLELGGKSANIILDDADFDSALTSSLIVCYHAGQGCTAPSRILLPQARYAEAVARIKALFEQLPYGDPDSMQQIMGPLISERQRERVLGYIQRGIAEGARLVTGGAIPAQLPRGYYVQPTLLADVDNRMSVAQQEIFGPVLCAIPYRDDDDAVRIANESIYGLSGAVASSSNERALGVARRIRSGTLNINNANFFAPDTPFGGYKQSGIGREMGVEGFAEYLETKVVALPA